MTRPIVTKREGETRRFDVNVGPAMRPTETIGSVASVTADGIAITEATHSSGAVVTFLASGGDPNIEYPIIIRFTVDGDSEQMLETCIYMLVLPDCD